MHPKDITPKNKECRFHGYRETDWSSGELAWKGVYVDDKMCGYCEGYNLDGSIDKDWTGYYSNGKIISVLNKKGYCYTWNTKPILL